MYFSDITDILQVYGAGLVTNADGVPTDYRTVDRDNFPFDESIHALEADSRLAGKFSDGGVTQNVLIGLDFRHYTDHAEFGFASAPPIDLFDPTYGVPITTPPLASPYLQQIQRQIGLYAEDVIKLSQWVLTAGRARRQSRDEQFRHADDQPQIHIPRWAQLSLPGRSGALPVIRDLIPADFRCEFRRHRLSADFRQSGRGGLEIPACLRAVGRASVHHAVGVRFDTE